MPPRLVLSCTLPGASGGVAGAAAVAVALSRQALRDRAAPKEVRPSAVLLVEAGAQRPRRPTLVASEAARELERALRQGEVPEASARGALCWVALSEERWAQAGRGLVADAAAELAVVHLPPSAWRLAIEEAPPAFAGALVRADPGAHRHVAALLARELAGRGVPLRVLTCAPGQVAARRALAGIDPGGEAGRRAARAARRLAGSRPVVRAAQAHPLGRVLGAERGQAMPLVVGAVLALVAATLALAALGGATTGAGRLQRGADLAAISAARSMRDDFARLFKPATLAGGAVNARHLEEGEYRARARAAARQAARRNGLAPRRLEVSFPGAGGAPTRVRALVVGEAPPNERVVAAATAEAAVADRAAPAAPTASGGGYSGPLAYRQGKPMRPDVAAAFDRLFRAASRAGVAITITSAFRSDAEQAALFAANPDPRWVAPPGRSLHRCATELDLGPSSSYGWLAAHAPRFGFVKRYSWEPWHFGYTRGPQPCSAAGSSGSRGNDGRGAGGAGLPSFVPAGLRRPISLAASRWNVSPGLLAAQLMAESGFDERAVSAAGAQGIAQFMPATAAAYGLRDPFDARAAIAAQARLMSDLLRQFTAIPLALAAYNAGPGAVAACECVPPYPETQAYVARILGLLGGAGEIAPPRLEVRLVA